MFFSRIPWISDHLSVVSEKGAPVESGDNMAYQEKAHRGDEEVVEIETLKMKETNQNQNNLNRVFYLIWTVGLLHHKTIKMMEDGSYIWTEKVNIRQQESHSPMSLT